MIGIEAGSSRSGSLNTVLPVVGDKSNLNGPSSSNGMLWMMSPSRPCDVLMYCCPRTNGDCGSEGSDGEEERGVGDRCWTEGTRLVTSMSESSAGETIRLKISLSVVVVGVGVCGWYGL